MAENWFPIIGQGCIGCLACVIACPKQLLHQEDTQILLKNSEKCPEGCKICSLVCPQKIITYYDGTAESLTKSFGGECACHSH